MPIIIRHYDNSHSAHEAVEALREAGLTEQQIGFLTKQGVQGHFDVPDDLNPDDMSRVEGAALGGLAGLVAAVVALTPLGPLAAAGTFFGALIGALAGAATGGAVASLMDAGISRETAQRLAATLEDNNAVLLSVEVPDAREAAVRQILADVDALHADEVRYFESYHAQHAEVPFEEFSHAYHYGYRAASHSLRPFAEAEASLQSGYEGDFARDREAIRVGYERYLNTVQILDQSAPLP